MASLAKVDLSRRWILPISRQPVLSPPYMDPNFWGIICVPLGVLICFGPALIATLFFSDKTDASGRGKPRD